MQNGLYIVATPIGNLGDLSPRAKETLANAEVIACEDTRITKKLFALLNISTTGKKFIVYQNYNEEDEAQNIINLAINDKKSIALVSDAGSPLISDPGYRVVSLCAKLNVKVVPLPGPCAAITALEMAGLPTDSFLFTGFLPVKDKELREKISTLTTNSVTTVFYEAPRRVKNTAKVMAEIIPEHDICVCRELTKAFESA